MQVCSNRLQHFLELYRVPYSLIGYAPAFTSQAAPANMLLPCGEMVKTTVLQGQAESYLAVLPASFQVDLRRFAKIVGEPLRLATEERIRDLFPDCELGAIPPFGKLYGVPTYVDEALAGENEIVFPAGHYNDAVRMSYLDFQGLTMPEVCSFAIPGGGEEREIMPENGRLH